MSPTEDRAGHLRVGRSLIIPMSEIELRHSPSGGPGGQHANKASTRVDLSWNIETSNSLGPRQRERIRHRLRNRIDTEGTLHLSSGTYRSQTRNREEVLERLARLLEGALRVERRRRPTKPSAQATEARLRAKRKRSEIKRLRANPDE